MVKHAVAGTEKAAGSAVSRSDPVPGSPCPAACGRVTGPQITCQSVDLRSLQ